MKRTFFDYLGIAHLERTHSQTLSWILSKDNQGLSDIGKKDIIENLFRVSDIDVEYIMTEFDKIDILIKAEKKVICIENKLNSSLRQEQLKNYEKIIQEKFNDKELYFFVLTLIEEINETSSNWENISYSNLLNVLENIPLNNNNDGLIIQEYIKTLRNLVSLKERFINDPTKYPNVFSDGYKKKSKKLVTKNSIYNKEQGYIRDNQLETTFQRLYYHKVIQELNLEEKLYVFETHGNAILATDFVKEKEFEGKKYNFGFSFQAGTFKFFCIISDYKNSKKEDVNLKIIDLFKDLSKEHSLRLNKPRSKGQYSLTKRDEKDFGISICCFCNRYRKELCLAKKLFEKVKDKLHFE